MEEALILFSTSLIVIWSIAYMAIREWVNCKWLLSLSILIVCAIGLISSQDYPLNYLRISYMLALGGYFYISSLAWGSKEAIEIKGAKANKETKEPKALQ